MASPTMFYQSENPISADYEVGAGVAQSI